MQVRDLTEERRQEEKVVAKAMSEQRKELEGELKKLESENAAVEVSKHPHPHLRPRAQPRAHPCPHPRQASMHAELDKKDHAIRKSERERISLQEQLEAALFRLEVAERDLSEARDAKKEVGSAASAHPETTEEGRVTPSHETLRPKPHGSSNLLERRPSAQPYLRWRSSSRRRGGRTSRRAESCAGRSQRSRTPASSCWPTSASVLRAC